MKGKKGKKEQKGKKELTAAERAKAEKVTRLQGEVLEAWKADQVVFEQSQTSAKTLGGILNSLKEEMPHGKFGPWLEANKIDRNRASYCMRVANGKGPKSRAKHKAKTNKAARVAKTRMRAQRRAATALTARVGLTNAEIMSNDPKVIIKTCVKFVERELKQIEDVGVRLSVGRNIVDQINKGLQKLEQGLESKQKSKPVPEVRPQAAA